MESKKFFDQNCKFGNSPSMFDTNGKIIKNHIKWENYIFKTNKTSIQDSNKKYINRYFCLN